MVESSRTGNVLLLSNVANMVLGTGNALPLPSPLIVDLGRPSSKEFVGQKVTLLVLPVPDLSVPELIYIILDDETSLLSTSGRQLCICVGNITDLYIEVPRNMFLNRLTICTRLLMFLQCLFLIGLMFR